MTKVCVFSDSHQCSANMMHAVSLENPDYVFFLGDGESDINAVMKEHPAPTYYCVRGNCDQHSALPIIQNTTICGIKIFSTHGHTYAVKTDSSFCDLRYTAMEADANIVLFGHTHIPYRDRSLGMEILNPGTIGNVSAPTYGVITIDAGAITTELKTLQPHP